MEKYVIDNNTDPDVDTVPDTVVDAGADTCDKDEDIGDADNVEDDDDADADVGDVDDVDKGCRPCVTVFLSLRLP